MPPKLNPLEAIKQSKGAKAVGSLADQVRAEMAAEKAYKAGVHYADPNVKPTMKFSEALGITGSEGKTLNFTETDRSRVKGENMGGFGFSGLQHYSPKHRDANAVWGFGSEEIAKRKIKNSDPEKTVFTTYIGSPDQHKSNSIVVRDALKNVQAANQQNLIHPEQIKLINKRIREARNKTGTLLFPSDFDITDPQAMNAATTFDRRSAISNALMGVGVQGPMKKLDFKKANPNVEYKDPAQMDSILRRETEPMLEGLPNYSVGPRLFTLDGGLLYRPDLNFAFPHQPTGTDMGVMFEMPTIREAAPDFIKKKGYKPNDVINARAMSMGAPSQFVSEDYLTYLQKIGRKKGGLAHMAKGGAMRGMKKLKGIYNEVETSMGRGKGAQFEQTASPLNIIKETGGNWSPSGDMVYKSRLDRELENLQKGQFDTSSKTIKYFMEQDELAGNTARKAQMEQALAEALQREAVNNYVKSNLKNYVTKQMATEADPVRKLAEQGITAFPKNVDEYGDLNLRDYGSAEARVNRQVTGNAPKGVAKSPLAKHYETMTDESISIQPAREYQRMQNLPKMQRPAGTTDSPWLLKLDPDTPIFSLNRDADFDKLGFTHMIDVLREDVAAGRIRPEQLSKITIEQAVRRTHDYDETLKANMLNARIAEQANANVFKEYPEGYRWVQLDQPGQFALESDIMGHSVRGYEPPIGHPDYSDISGKSGSSGYGHGGWEAIKSGQAKVYSLRDPKGQSHVTLEVGPNDHLDYNDWFKKQSEEIQNKIAKRRLEDKNHDIYSGPEYLADRGKILPKITQIKGKQNAAPNEEYLPFVQDFVKSGDWSEVGDISNTGLRDVKFMTNPDVYEKYLERGLKVPKYATEKELDELHNEYLRLAEPRNYKPPAEGMARGGLAYMGKGGAAKGAKAVMSLADKVRAEMAMEKGVLPATEREANLDKFLSTSQEKRRLYHATPANFKEFQGKGFDPTISGNATWLTPNKKKQPAAHNTSSRTDVYREGVNVMPVHVKAEKPLVLDDRIMEDWAKAAYANDSPEFPFLLAPEWLKKIKEDGYDSIFHPRSGEVIMLEPNKIKSAIGNRGTYDINDPDITKAHGGLAHMAKGGRNVRGVQKAMSLADEVRAEMAAEKAGAKVLSKEVGMPKGIKHLSFEDYTPNEVELVNLEAVQKGMGYGSSAMNKITDAADKNKINMMLIPAGDEAKRARLSDFYGRFGFSADGDVMRRSHKANGGLAYMGKGGAPKGVKKVMSLADQVRAEMAMEKNVLPAAEREANLKNFLAPSKTPMRLYHGTTATEGGKGTEAIRRIKSSKDGALGSGVYMTPNTNYADQYTYKGAGNYEGGNTLPVYAQIKNPLVIDGSASNDPMVEALIRLGMDEAQALRMVERAYENKGYIGKEVESRARAAGYDGLMQYGKDGELGEVVSYNPSAVKSAIGNRGTYDINEPDLSKAHGGLTLLKRKAA